MGLSASTIRKAAEASAEAGKKEESARIKLLEEMGHRVIKHFQDKVRLEEMIHSNLSWVESLPKGTKFEFCRQKALKISKSLHMALSVTSLKAIFFME